MQAKSNIFSILLAFQTLSSRQLNNRGFPLVILKDFEDSEIPAITPADILEMVNRT